MVTDGMQQKMQPTTTTNREHIVQLKKFEDTEGRICDRMTPHREIFPGLPWYERAVCPATCLHLSLTRRKERTCATHPTNCIQPECEIFYCVGDVPVATVTEIGIGKKTLQTEIETWEVRMTNL